MFSKKKYKGIIEAITSEYLLMIDDNINQFSCGDRDWLSNTSTHKYISIKEIESNCFSHSLTISKPIAEDAISSIITPVKIVIEDYGTYMHTPKQRYFIGDKENIRIMLIQISDLI